MPVSIHHDRGIIKTKTWCTYMYTLQYPHKYNEKALKCKPSALIFGRGRAKKSIALQGSYNIGIHVQITVAGKGHPLHISILP